VNDLSASAMGISELAERAGVTPRTIRYYVAEGLLPAPSGRGQRRAYSTEHLARLDLIRELKAAYLPLHEIRRRLIDQSSAQRPHPESSRVPGGTLPAAVSPRLDQVSSADLPALGAAMPPVAVASAERRLPIGFGGTPGIGRIEIFDPPETVWRRHVLAPGVEIHVRETDDPRLAEAIERLIREAADILDGRPSASSTSGTGKNDSEST
jgi:DNA-binding transcriptional MerR regulator